MKIAKDKAAPSLSKLGLSDIWKIPQKDYLLQERVGQGSFGEVVRATCKMTGLQVAVKLIDNYTDYEYDTVKVLREIKLLRSVHSLSRYGSSCYFPELIDVIVPSQEKEAKNIFVVMEFESTDLRKLLKLGTDCKLKEDHVVLIIYNLLCALKYLHSLNIVHRDIKPSNILINKDCQIKICDFGLARTLPESCTGQGSGNTRRIRESVAKLEGSYTEPAVRKMISHKIRGRLLESMKAKKRSLTSHVCSRWYRAPEISLLEKQYDTAADVWSLGCCFYELLRVLSELQGGPSCKDNRIMIPGECCYPLSPKGKDSLFNPEDQMFLTLQQVGPIDADDMSFVTTADAKKYLTLLSAKMEEPSTRGKPYHEKLVGISPPLLKLLDNMLQINPFQRWSASECLKLEIFDAIRKPELEKSGLSKLRLEVDSDGAFDYKTSKSLKLTKQDYVRMIASEIQGVKRDRKEAFGKLGDLTPE